MRKAPVADKARFYMPRRESPIVTVQSGQPLPSKDWYTLFWQVYDSVTNGIPQPTEAIVVTASPYQFTASIKGQVNISGGAGLTIQFSRDGTNYLTAGTSPCMIPVCKGDRIRVTYGGAPSMTFVPM